LGNLPVKPVVEVKMLSKQSKKELIEQIMAVKKVVEFALSVKNWK